MRLLLATVIYIHFFLIGQAVAQTTQSRLDILKGLEECNRVSVDVMREACLAAGDQILQTPVGKVTSAPEDPYVAPPTSNRHKDLETQDSSQSETERLGILKSLGLGRNALGADGTEEKLAAYIIIERVTYNKDKIHTFYTRDGDVIKQDKGALRMRLPDAFPATATLERRLSGSKWLTFTDIPGRSYKIKIVTP